jgi:hypothetical protein
MTFPSRSFGRNCPAVAALFPIRRLTIRHLSVGAPAAWSLYPLSGNRKFSNPLPSSGESGELRKLARRGMACPGWLGFAPNGHEPRLLMPRLSRRAVVMADFLEAARGDVIAPSPEIEEAGVAIVAQALLVIPSRICGEQHTARLQRLDQCQQNLRQFLAGYVEKRGVCKNSVEPALGQLHHQEILMENLALRMRARHGDELLRSVEPYGFVPQGSEVTQIPAGSTTEIKDRIRRVALYRVEERCIVTSWSRVPFQKARANRS